jgi:predicted dithiol-disulfide oxidoreductase (DUF899 family)
MPAAVNKLAVSKRDEKPLTVINARSPYDLFHYARGLDGLWGMYQWLDRAPRVLNDTGYWLRPHDAYDEQ